MKAVHWMIQEGGSTDEKERGIIENCCMAGTLRKVQVLKLQGDIPK